MFFLVVPIESSSHMIHISEINFGFCTFVFLKYADQFYMFYFMLYKVDIYTKFKFRLTLMYSPGCLKTAVEGLSVGMYR